MEALITRLPELARAAWCSTAALVCFDETHWAVVGMNAGEVVATLANAPTATEALTRAVARYL